MKEAGEHRQVSLTTRRHQPVQAFHNDLKAWYKRNGYQLFSVLTAGLKEISLICSNEELSWIEKHISEVEEGWSLDRPLRDAEELLHQGLQEHIGQVSFRTGLDSRAEHKAQHGLCSL